MALRNIAWHMVEPGQLVSFIYKNKNETKGVKRTVIIVNPDLKYRKKSTGRVKRYVVGLQIDTAVKAPITKSKVENLFKRLGGLEIEEGAISAKMPDKLSPAETGKIYRKLMGMSNLYRTYDRRECLKRRVYLEIDSNLIPNETLKRFERKQMKELEKSLEVGLNET